MIGRVTNLTLMGAAQRNLQASKSALAADQNRASSLKAISVPSDDPVGTSASLRIRSEQAANAQYSRNMDDAKGWLATVDSTISASTDIMHRVRDLVVRGANDGSLDQTAKNGIATELDSLKSELLGQANMTYQGRTIFAGNSNAGVAFDPSYTFTGTAGSTVQRRVDAASTVQVDADGSAVYGQGAGSVFALIDTVSASLRSGGPVAPQISAIDDRMNAMLTVQSAVGARENQVQSAQELNMQKATALEGQRSSVEDVDLAKAVLDLQTQQVAYQGAIAVTARVLQPTLMDFLK
jgi:flagellar hook-associated protein 3 FlgL